MQVKLALIGLTTLLLNSVSFSQEGWLQFPAKKTDSTQAKQLDFNAPNGSMTLHEDGRMKKLGEFVREGESTVTGVKINGYRIVIFFDQDKSVVSQQKANFLSRYKEHKAYIDYVAPNYRIRVGNFRTRLEAEALKAELLLSFPTAVVVEDYIELPALPNETQSVPELE